MNARSISMAIAVMMLMIIAAPSAWAGKAFLDDFEDGNATDGSPVTWAAYTPPFDLGSRTVVDGSYVLTPSDTPIPYYGPYYAETDSFVEGGVYRDVSIYAVVSVSQSDGYSVGFNARDPLTVFPPTHEPVSEAFLTAALQYIPESGIQSVTIGYVCGWECSGRLTSTPTQLAAHATDVHLQFDVFGDFAELFAWADGESKPSRPTTRARVPGNIASEGAVGVWYGAGIPPYETGSASFRFVEVRVIPEPTGIALAACGLLTMAALHRR